MVKKIWCFTLLLFSFGTYAQVVITAQLPSAGMVQKDQLWNLVLVNNTPADIEAKVLLTLQDAATGQPVLSAGTGEFIFAKGMKIINSRQVQPIQYTYASTNVSDNYLPLGSYIACYSVVKRRADANEKVGEECIRVNILPLSPPMLIAPANNAVLQPGAPQFSWTSPAPLNMFTNLNYEISIAEMLPGQSSVEALLYNPPVYAKTDARVTYENYPASYEQLQKGKRYAWQVVARNGENYSAPTEVWSFSIAADSSITKAGGFNYVSLSGNKNEAGHVQVTDSLYIKYYSFDKDHEAIVRFLSADGKLIEGKKQHIHYGDNFLQYRLSRRFEQDKLYLIEITDLQNKSFVSFFSIKQPN